MKKSRVCLTSIVVLSLLIVFIQNVSFASALTGSIGNARMVLYPQYDQQNSEYEVLEKSILVKNVNTVPINIKLVTDEEGSEFIEIIDKEFILESGSEESPTQKKAVFLVKVKEQGRYEGKINVFFASDNKDEPGVVLNSQIIVIASEKEGADEDTFPEKDEDGNGRLITGNFIRDSNGDVSKIFVLMSIMTLILLAILALLFYSKKRRKSDEKKTEVKVNEKKKGKKET